MKRLLPSLLFVSLLLIGFVVVAQDDANEVSVTAENSTVKTQVTLPTTLEEPEQEGYPQADLFDKFEPIENPPLKLGDAGDRVRELQATLNAKLAGQTIRLIGEMFIGDTIGPKATSKKSKMRFAFSPRHGTAFQIRGDWIPLNEKEQPLDFEEQNVAEGADKVAGEPRKILKRASFVRLTEEPLKVDGVFGQHTQAGVALFQLQQGLPVTGEVDVVTLDKLEPLVPTNPLLALVMFWVGENFGNRESDNYPYVVKTVTAFLATLLILLASIAAYQVARMMANSTRLLSRWLFTPESSPWFTAFRKNKVFLRVAQFAPALFIYEAALLIFPDPAHIEKRDVFPYLNTFQDWQVFVSRLGLAYASLVVMLVAFACANAVNSVFNPDEETENPIGSIVQASKRLIGVIGTLLIIASLSGRNPLFIVGGLGALVAVFMLVFRDYLLGLASSVQIIANRVVSIGDWITMPKFNADGDVKEISLTLIKVQNFDKTISTIPTSAVLCESFQNWTGMRQAGGRRIKRALLIDITSIQVCTDQMVQKFEQIELIREYIQAKKEDLEEYNRKRDVAASVVNSRRLTNIGTFRAYLDRYLQNHPGLSGNMTFLVRHLQPTNNGLPIEIYAFCVETDWSNYEAVQADLFDHILAVLPEFGLRAYQESQRITTVTEVSDAFPPHLQAALAEIESLIDAANDELAENPRRRPASRVQNIRERIDELELDEHVTVEASKRTIILRHLD